MIVGLGAAAGGLEPLKAFLAHLPAETSISCVVIQDLDAPSASHLRDVLGQYSWMRVLEAREGVQPRADHVYVSAPGVHLTLERGAFAVSSVIAAADEGAIDVFFRSLAAEKGERAVGLLLSGAGRDGATGLRSIKERHGLTLVQAPLTADHASMLRNAIAAGCVDHVLPADALARRVLEYARNLTTTPCGTAYPTEVEVSRHLGRICALIRQHTGTDFSHYKDGTLRRRIQRRIHARGLAVVEPYLEALAEDAAEAEALAKEVLIGVTQFFRDPSSFEALARLVVPRLSQGRPADAPIRIWAPGCASGEEAYSLAILVREHLERIASERPVQIFATDLDADALAEARSGRYPASIAQHMDGARLRRFFQRTAEGYEVSKALRQMCVFSAHSLSRDPPFSRLDLVSCRNVLIYFSQELQSQLVALFHYALRRGGFLFLGPSESLGGGAALFEPIDASSRIFQRKEVAARTLASIPLAPRAAAAGLSGRAPRSVSTQQRIAAAFERIVLAELAVPCAVVDPQGDIVRVAGRLDRYLRFPAGAVSINLLDLAPSSLRAVLREMLQSAVAERRRVTREHLVVALGDSRHPITLDVRPLFEVEAASPLLLVALQEVAQDAAAGRGDDTSDRTEQPALERAEAELRATRGELQTTIEGFESANEELQAANEELQASQEELRSLNEELETVNAELRHKVAELASANNDLQNLFASTEIATLFLDRALRITKFTPAATKLFHLIEGDVGRPVSDFASPFRDQDIAAIAREVLDRLTLIERQARIAEDERWFILRILPYRTLDARIEGVVVNFVDISDLKRAESALRRTTERERFLAETIEHATTPFGAGLPDGRLLLFNRAFAELTGYRREELEGASLSWMRDLTPPEWRASEAEALERAVHDRAAVTYQKEYRRKNGQRVPVELTVQPVFDDQDRLLHYRAFVSDISERKRIGEQLERLALHRQLALDAAKLGWWHLDPATGIASWDEGYARIFGISGRSRPNAEILDRIIHPGDLQRLRAEVQAALDPLDPKPFATEYRINRPDGALCWVEAHGTATFEGAGAERCATSFVGTVADITERRHAEEALRAALVKAEAGDRMLAALMTYVPDGITVCDADGSIRMVSQHGQDLLGRPHAGKRIEDVARDWTVYRADGETLMPLEELPLLRALAGEAVRDVELAQRNSDGDTLMLLCNAAPIRDPGGQVVAAVVAWRDISSLKAAEAAVRESALRLRLALRAARMVAWEHDLATGQVSFSENAETVLGFSSGQVSGAERDAAIHRDDVERHRAAVDQALANGRGYVSVYRHTRPQGILWLEEHGQAMADQAGTTARLVGVVQDITERKLADEALREAHDTREAMLDNMTDGLVIASCSGEVIDMNPAALRLHGFIDKAEALRALTEYPQIFEVRDASGQEQPPEAWPLTRAYHGGLVTNHELWVRRRDTGQAFVGSYSGTAVRDAAGRIRFGLITIRDISAQKRAEEQIRQLAFYDPLTGLPNRRLLEERLDVALAQVKRQGGPLAVMVVDLDHFKSINDALGHTIGDGLLVEVAQRMSLCVRASDTVARPGGDEFVLVLPGIDADGAAHLAEKLVAQLAEPLRLDAHELTVSCSLGISLAPDDGWLARELIARADTAMYRAKQAGRNRYQFFTEDMQREALRVMTLEHQLRHALSGSGLQLHYQPQVDVSSGRPIGLEALVRWEHPTAGLLGADGFVPFAERSGLILDLGSWVLRAAAKQLEAWASAGLPLLPVAVNLSAQQFRHPERRRALHALVCELLAESGLAPALLELEITENSLLEDTEETLTALQELRGLGVRLTLDDFGTGYSSLSTLNAFPVDRLKIDQSFVRAAPEHPKQAAIVETILALGRHLEFEVIAEGVETAVHLEQLRRQGCHQAQGYYFSRPLPPSAVEHWLQRAV